jgi:hypothetical protein
MIRRRHRACGCGGRGAFASSTVKSPIGRGVSILGRYAQATGDCDLMTASLVAKG